MKLSNANVKTGLACLAVVAMGAGLSLLSPATVATTASADTGATTYSSDTLLMHDEVGYSAGGITFKITVPDKYLDALKRTDRESSTGSCSGDGWSYNWLRQFEFSVLITRAEKPDGYTNAYPTNVYQNLSEVSNIKYADYFSGPASQDYMNDPEFYTFMESNSDYYIESYFFTYGNKLVAYSLDLPSFDSTNTAYFTIPRAEDSTKDYYYYAQIVAPYMERRTAFLWEHAERGVTLVENIPFEYGKMFYGQETTLSRQGARSRLEDEDIALTEEERKRLQETVGVPTEGYIQTTVHYKELANKNDPTSVVDKTMTVSLPAATAQRKSEAIDQFELKGQNDGTWGKASFFNANYEGFYIEGEFVYETGNRIIRQVDAKNPYIYTYDYTTNTASITVNYIPFSYKDVAIKVTNNDPDDGQNLTLYVYTTDIVQNGDEYTVSWNYADLCKYMQNQATWTCKITDECIGFNESEYWSISMDGSNVSVSFNAKDQEELETLDLKAVAEIVEDYECDVFISYDKIVGWDVTSKCLRVEKVVTTIKTTYTAMTLIYNTFDNFKNLDIYGEIDKAGKLNGVGLFVPKGIQAAEVSDTEWALTLQYDYPKFFVFENNSNDDVTFVEAVSTSNEFFLGDLVDEKKIPDGYRIKDVAFDEEFIRVEKDAERPDDYKKTKITVKKVSDSQFHLASIEYTDFFNLEIEYFETYVSVYGKNTPFAIKKTFNTQVKVSDFSGENGIYDIKYADVCRLLGKENLIVCEIINADSDFNVEYDSVSTYKVSITYSKASVRLINEHGTITEKSIPLTRYVDWLEMMGNDDWTILMLNNEKNKYFRFSNDVAREELYGLFSVAFFEKQVSDIADWFEKETENGCAVLWETEEVYGSDFYKWCQSTQWKTLGFSETCMWLCEVFDASQLNATLKYKFFYIDETVDGLYLSNGGADNDHDNDNSLINGGQDLIGWVGGGIDQFFNSADGIFVALRVIAGVALAGGAVFLVIWGLSKLGIIKSKTVMVEQKPKTGRKNERKKK